MLLHYQMNFVYRHPWALPAKYTWKASCVKIKGTDKSRSDLALLSPFYRLIYGLFYTTYWGGFPIINFSVQTDGMPVIPKKAPGESISQGQGIYFPRSEKHPFSGRKSIQFLLKIHHILWFYTSFPFKNHKWHLNCRSLMRYFSGVDATYLYFVCTHSLRMYIYKYIIFLILHQSRPD